MQHRVPGSVEGRARARAPAGIRGGSDNALADLPPSTSGQIGAAAKLNERHVRAWLGAMVTGGIVEYDPARWMYRLWPEHAPPLMRAAGIDNLAGFAPYMSLVQELRERVPQEHHAPTSATTATRLS